MDGDENRASLSITQEGRTKQLFFFHGTQGGYLEATHGFLLSCTCFDMIGTNTSLYTVRNVLYCQPSYLVSSISSLLSNSFEGAGWWIGLTMRFVS